MEKVKETKENAGNWLKRYGYWAMIAALFVLGLLLSLLTIGDVYRRSDLTEEEIYDKYIESGHIITPSDSIIIKDIITQAYSKDEVIDFNEYDKFVEIIQTYNYEKEDGQQTRFDSLSFYIYTKEAQSFIDFRKLPKWRIVLAAMNSILGILATITFMLTGIQDAFATSKLRKAKSNLQTTSMNASKYRLRSEEYYSKLHKVQLESIRRNELSIAGLMYEDYFDIESGRYIEGEYAEPIKEVLNKALAIRVVQLSFDLLATNVSSNQNDINKFNGLQEYQKKTAMKSIGLKILTIVFISFVGVSLIVSSQNPTQALMGMFSVVLMFIAGFLEYLKAYSYVIDEHCETIESKTRHLISLIEYCEEEEELLEASKMRDDMQAQMIKELEDKQKEVTNV